MPVFLVKIGSRYSNSPLSWVEVVEAMVMKRSSAWAVPAKAVRARAAARKSRLESVTMSVLP